MALAPAVEHELVLLDGHTEGFERFGAVTDGGPQQEREVGRSGQREPRAHEPVADGGLEQPVVEVADGRLVGEVHAVGVDLPGPERGGRLGARGGADEDGLDAGELRGDGVGEGGEAEEQDHGGLRGEGGCSV